MTKVKEQLLENTTISPNLAYLDRQISKGRWYKVIKSAFTETFGIELEIPGDFDLDTNLKCHNIGEKAFTKNAKYLIKTIFNKLEDISYCKLGCSTKSAFQLGRDAGYCPEFRGICSIYTLKELNNVINILKTELLINTDNKIICNLHIHIPISKNRYHMFRSSLQNSSLYLCTHPIQRLIFKYINDENSTYHYTNLIFKDLDIRANFPKFMKIFKNCYNTFEYRGMSIPFTELSYQSVMKHVLLISSLHKLIIEGKEPNMNLLNKLFIMQ